MSYNKVKTIINELKLSFFRINTGAMAAQIWLFLFVTTCHAGDCYWTSINVNYFTQGDAHLIGDRETGRSILVDTGPANYAENILLPYLHAHNIRQLDAVFISHIHTDHIGGMAALLRSEILVKEIFVDIPPLELIQAEWWGVSIAELLEIAELAIQRHVKISAHAAWQNYEILNGFYLKKIHAFNAGELAACGLGVNINNLSVVCKLVCGEKSVLFAGDIDRDVGAYLAERYDAELRCNILKVPHHGAESVADDSFFYSASPEVAIVPAPLLLWESARCRGVRCLLNAMQSHVLVNGEHGHITVDFASSDGAYVVRQESVPPALKIDPNTNESHINISVKPNSYLMCPADWWIFAHTQTGWYCLDVMKKWNFVVDAAKISPAYQGELIPLNDCCILEMPSGYNRQDICLYFCVDKPDGLLNNSNDKFFCAAMEF